MSEKSKKYYWIKLKTDFFDLPTIDWLADQNNGYAYIVLYQKLCLLTANSGGELTRRIGEMIIPYDAKKIAEVTRFDFDTVVVALELYKRLGLIYEQNDGILRLNGIEEMVGAETKWAEKKRIQRHKKEALPAGNGTPDRTKIGQSEDNVPHLSEDNVREEIRDKRLEIRDKRLETEIEKEREGTAAEPPAPRPSIPYEAIKAFYNETCLSFPRCTAMSESRKKAIKARFNSGYTLDDFKHVFIKAESSSFLKGRNDRNWTASFDWLIRDSSMAKVLDGNYDDHDTVPGPGPRPTGGGRNNTGFKTSNPFMEMLQEMEGRDQ